jgi:hypothetical protein
MSQTIQAKDLKAGDRIRIRGQMVTVVRVISQSSRSVYLELSNGFGVDYRPFKKIEVSE